HTSFARDWSSDVCSSDLRGGADRKVEIKADAHARIPQPTSGFSKLLVRYPLQPEQKAHLVPILAGKGRNAIAVRILKFFRPAVRSEERRVGEEGRCRGAL